MKYLSSLATLVLFGAACGFGQVSPVPLFGLPSRIVGHPLPEPTGIINSSNPNLVEGRELFDPAGVTVDTSVSPPIVYVSDTSNNRVLGWRNATSFRNGQTADLVIGQPDFYRTLQGGPGNPPFTAGLTAPTGLAVDKSGNLYVADSGNNRILRFPKPFSNIGNQVPDLIIGQPNLTSNRANYTGTTDQQGVSFRVNGTGIPYNVALAFDGAGNLWITDPDNRRALQFTAADVNAGGSALRAVVEVGQLNFGPPQPAVANAARTTANVFAIPAAIGIDPAGRLFVSDSDANNTMNRVLVFVPPFTNGMSASRIMGVFPASAPSLDAASRTVFSGVGGLFFIPGSSGKVGIVDSHYHRILLFDSFDKWPDQTTTFSPLATAVIGQTDFLGIGNNGNKASYFTAASARGLNTPTAAYFTGTELFVADTLNERVVVLPFSGGTFGPATRLLGQDYFYARSPNLIEGREFQFGGDSGIAIDTSTDTPHLYIADTQNHRVLGFNDMRKVKAGDKADLVIGQADFTTALCNYQGDTSPDSGNPDKPTQSSLCAPTGLLVDGSGNLYVADSFNSRVLRFPTPFAHLGPLPQADLVLGQRNFTTKITDPSAFTMNQPYGLAFAGTTGLLVSDTLHHRVLMFPFSPGGSFNAGTDNGKAATRVFGQPDFSSVRAGSDDASLNSPHHIATDGEAHPYVADTGNGRVVIYDQINNNPNTGARAALTLTGLSAPRAVYVNQTTGEVWVGDNSTVVKKFPLYSTLLINKTSTGSVASPQPLALAQDSFGNLAVADLSQRVGFYFPGLQAVNGGNFIGSRALSPGVFASICSPGTACDGRKVSYFGTATAVYNALPNPIPYPKTLGDIQVLFNGDPVPLTYISPLQINFVVPMSAPTSGTADLQVIQPSTGRIYAAGTANMTTVSPAIFATQDYGGGNRQAAVINVADNTVNNPSNCAARGSYISIYATGQGFLPNAPADGAPPQGQVTTPYTPRFFVGVEYTDLMVLEATEPPKSQLIQFSGLSPEFPGVWQINAYIPKQVAPGNQVPILLTALGTSSNDIALSGYRTTICVK